MADQGADGAGQNQRQGGGTEGQRADHWGGHSPAGRNCPGV